MKNNRKITRLRLDDNHDDEAIISGLVSSEPDYKISLSINKKLRIALKNSTPVKITDETGKEHSFSRFSFSDNSHGITYNLVSNRSGKNFLFKKLRNIDFIFQVNDPEQDGELLNKKLRETECISAVFSIDPKSLDRNLYHLIQLDYGKALL